jgi:serine/threonine protein kinase
VERDILDNVFLVSWKVQFYIYKTVDRFFYDPGCTTIFEEISYMRLFRGFPSIGQLIAIVKSQTPFKTNIQDDDGPDCHWDAFRVLRERTLEEAIEERSGRGSSWESWPKQLTFALLTLHCSGITHMDIKPAVAINPANKAVLIDIGVGYIYELAGLEF